MRRSCRKESGRESGNLSRNQRSDIGGLGVWKEGGSHWTRQVPVGLSVLPMGTWEVTTAGTAQGTGSLCLLLLISGLLLRPSHVIIHFLQLAGALTPLNPRLTELLLSQADNPRPLSPETNKTWRSVPNSVISKHTEWCCSASHQIGREASDLNGARIWRAGAEASSLRGAQDGTTQTRKRSSRTASTRLPRMSRTRMVGLI
ncbi:hypothetical protein V8F33_003616 [Rhypophila sp. PSN 637]